MFKKRLNRICTQILVIIFVSGYLSGAAAAQSLIPNDPASIVSGIYSVNTDRALISNIPSGTTLNILQTGILNGPSMVSDIPPTDPLVTGTDLRYMPEGAAERDIRAVITGDVSGDGMITITDMVSIKAHLLGVTLLTGAYEAAADTNTDGEVSITDFIQVKSCILRLSAIPEGPVPGGMQYRDVTRLLGAGETCTLPIADLYGDTATCQLRNENIVSVSDDWLVTGIVPGTTVIDISVNDEIADSYLATVMNAPDRVEISAGKNMISVGETVALATALPVGTASALNLECSDANILQLSQTNEVTGINEGQATVTVKTFNGLSAGTTIDVRPQAASLTLSQTNLALFRKKTYQLEAARMPDSSIEDILWTSSDPSVATVSSTGLVTAVAKGSAVITAQTRLSQISASCTVDVSIPIQVALTFDDGPSADSTRKLLDYLKQNNITVTFFLVGNRLNGNAELVKRMCEDGHEIGYHSYNHSTQTSLSNGEIISQYNQSTAILNQITGKVFTVWRAPGGTCSDRVLAQIPLPHIIWTIDTRDWDTRNSALVKNSIINGAKDGNIILLHDVHMSTVNGAIAALDYLKDKGYEFVTVTQIITRDGSAAVNGRSYKRGAPP